MWPSTLSYVGADKHRQYSTGRRLESLVPDDLENRLYCTAVGGQGNTSTAIMGEYVIDKLPQPRSASGVGFSQIRVPELICFREPGLDTICRICSVDRSAGAPTIACVDANGFAEELE